MNTVEEHPHSFLPGAWPFKEPINTLAYTSARVLSEKYPVLLVFHDHDGEWQFLHGEVGADDECKIICLGCAYELDDTVGILADMPSGWMAFRDAIDRPWQCEPYEDDVDEGEG